MAAPDTVTLPRIPAPPLPRWPGSAGARARVALATATCGAFVWLLVVLGRDAASGPSRALPWSYRGPLVDWIWGPLRGHGAPLTDERFYALLAGLFALWVAATRLAGMMRPAMAWGTIVLAHAVMLLAPPIGLSDSFQYLGFGRLVGDHGLNPYTHVLSDAPHDPTFGFATWPHLHSPYGPLFTALSTPVGMLGVDTGLWMLKAVAAIASLALVALTARAARRRGHDPVRAAVFVGLNPLLLAYAVAGAHNDVLFGALAVAGIVAVLDRREAVAGRWIAAAVGVKASAGLLLPFAIAGAANRRRLALAAGAGLAVVYGTAIAVWGPAVLGSVLAQGNVRSERSVPGLLATQVLGSHGLPASVPTLATGIFAVVVTVFAVRAWRGSMDWIDAAGWSTLAFLLSLSWLMPWYVVWLLPLAALAREPRLRLATILCVALLIVIGFPVPVDVRSVVP
jgi:hypothetical protein